MSNTVAWNPLAWNTSGESGVKQQTPDLSSLINAAKANGWLSGGALSFKIEGNATANNILNARSFEFNSSRAGVPQLTIEYTTVDLCTADATPPTITRCPANVTILTTGTDAIVTWNAPIIADNCTANITPSVTSAPTTGLVSGSVFPVGTTTIKYNAKDAANNAALPCSFTVKVTNPCIGDVTAPTFTNCPSNISIQAIGTSASATWVAPTLTDNCPTAIIPSVVSAPTAGLVSGSTFPLGATTITYTAKDAANNNATPCTFTVMVQDASVGASYKIFINELAPKGTLAISEDWIEIYNDNDEAVSTDSIFITGKKTKPFAWRLKGLSIPAKGFLVLIADKDTLKGADHVDLKLGSSGESVFYSNK